MSVCKDILVIFLVPAISALIYARHTRDAKLIEHIFAYGMFAVLIRLLWIFPVRQLVYSLDTPRQADDFERILPYSALLAVILPWAFIGLRKWLGIRLEVKEKTDEK